SENGTWISQWSEGGSQQLSKNGYIKWDVLSLNTLKYIYDTCYFITGNRGISFGIPQKKYSMTMRDGTRKTFMSGDMVETTSGPKRIEEVIKILHESGKIQRPDLDDEESLDDDFQEHVDTIGSLLV